VTDPKINWLKDVKIASGLELQASHDATASIRNEELSLGIGSNPQREGGAPSIDKAVVTGS
jgi:hypothetical protein